MKKSGPGSSVSRKVIILPVLFGFYVMGFCDIVGIATTYVKADFNLSETLAGFVPSMVFLWFLLVSIPAALLMNRLGRKTTVQISNLITIAGLLIPVFSYNFTTSMITFALLGIGNTILQVSLNPLLTNVVPSGNLTSSLTAGQVIKAVSSFMGPVIAALAVTWFGSWQYLFPIFAVITLISSVWLHLVNIPKEELQYKGASVQSTFSILRVKPVLLCFIGIVVTVGLDVGMNTLTPKLLIERSGLAMTTAGLGSSVYFIFRTAGAFIGAILLTRISEMKYLRFNMVIVMVVLALLFAVREYTLILGLVGVFAFALSCVFPILFSLALKSLPERSNEISGLIITGVFGGAIVPPLMGWLTDTIGNQTGSLIVLGFIGSYLLLYSFYFKAGAEANAR
jgi:fucose permease